MDVSVFDRFKSKEVTNIEGNFGSFDPKKNISECKLIFIFPSGKCLFMPYSKDDDKTRKDDRYSHRAYLAHAIDLIIEKLNVDKNALAEERKRFIEDIDGYYIYGFIAAILRKGVAIVYDVGNVDIEGNEMEYNEMIFGKVLKPTESQIECIFKLKEPIMRELYTMGILILNQDNNINLNDEEIKKWQCSQEISLILSGQNPMDLGTFYNTLDISDEPRR